MGLRDRLKKLAKEAEKDFVVIEFRDGTTRMFSHDDVAPEMFLTQIDLFQGESRKSEVLDAVRQATPESRGRFEERYGEITMSAKIVAADYQGGWVEVFDLLEDGTVQRTYHEGGSEEARRIKRDAQQGVGAGPN